jgi:hypothetical protein
LPNTGFIVVLRLTGEQAQGGKAEGSKMNRIELHGELLQIRIED